MLPGRSYSPSGSFWGPSPQGCPCSPSPMRTFTALIHTTSSVWRRDQSHAPLPAQAPPPPPHCLLGQQRDAGTSSPPPAPRYYRHKPSPIHPCMYTRSISALPFRVRGGDQGGQQSALASCVTSTSDFTPHQASHLTLPPLHNPRQFEFKH